MKRDSSNMVLNGIKNNLNDALQENARVSDIIIKTLIEYGNTNFAYDIDTKGISGKSGSILLGIKALGNTISELLATLNNVAGNLNNDMTGLHNEAFKGQNLANDTFASMDSINNQVSMIHMAKEKAAKEFTKSPNWIQLKELHSVIHKGIQDVIDDKRTDEFITYW